MDKNIVQSYYEEHTRDYRTIYVADIMHVKYAEHKIIKDYNRSIVRNKAEKLIEKWQQMEDKDKNAEFAHNKNLEIKKLNNEIENILINGLAQNIDLLELYNKKSEAKLKKSDIIARLIKQAEKSIAQLQEPIRPKSCCVEHPYPEEPQQADFVAEYGLIHKILPFLKSIADSDKRKEFKAAYKSYQRGCNDIDEINKAERERYESGLKAYSDKLYIYRERKEMRVKKLQDYNEKLNQINQETNQKTQKIESLKEKIIQEDREAVEEYSSLLLEHSPYPIEFDKNVQTAYNSDLLAVDYSLPSIDTFPFVGTTAKAVSKEYDDALYQIALRSIYEIFADTSLSSINSVAFNGWVTVLNKANGKRETNCIMSIMANREQVSDIDFFHIDPKTCFKALKGIASSQLSTITSIKPIVVLNKSDKRFVEHYNVESGIDDSTNLAAMYWEDFEHLIRELFEKEFRSNGGEVKVTRASRDGGVDAIAFDPDPIRGGKIVIQAKRYTNTVGVSAVRDLYGTVMNEGATKGILVTTSDYGGDSYEFAKDKPITLMNGANLLYLLEKHGQHARIDINEAKKLMSND